MKRWLIMALFCGIAAAQQVNNDIIPASPGLNLGRSNQRWNGFFNNVNITGTCLVNGVSCLSGGGGGGGVTPGGTLGQIQTNGGPTLLGGFTASGDATINTTTGVITVRGVNNVLFTSLATGLLKNTSGTISVAVSADVISMFSGTCNSSTWLRGDGQCVTPPGGGNVSNSGTPVSQQVATWNGVTTITGSTGFVNNTTGGSNNADELKYLSGNFNSFLIGQGNQAACNVDTVAGGPNNSSTGACANYFENVIGGAGNHGLRSGVIWSRPEIIATDPWPVNFSPDWRLSTGGSNSTTCDDSGSNTNCMVTLKPLVFGNSALTIGLGPVLNNQNMSQGSLITIGTAGFPKPVGKPTLGTFTCGGSGGPAGATYHFAVQFDVNLETNGTRSAVRGPSAYDITDVTCSTGQSTVTIAAPTGGASGSLTHGEFSVGVASAASGDYYVQQVGGSMTCGVAGTIDAVNDCKTTGNAVVTLASIQDATTSFPMPADNKSGQSVDITNPMIVMGPDVNVSFLEQFRDLALACPASNAGANNPNVLIYNVSGQEGAGTNNGTVQIYGACGGYSGFSGAFIYSASQTPNSTWSQISISGGPTSGANNFYGAICDGRANGVGGASGCAREFSNVTIALKGGGTASIPLLFEGFRTKSNIISGHFESISGNESAYITNGAHVALLGSEGSTTGQAFHYSSTAGFSAGVGVCPQGTANASSERCLTSSVAIKDDTTGGGGSLTGYQGLWASGGSNSTVGNLTVKGELSTAASTTTTAGLNIPHGTAPTSPVNGDCWTTTAGLFCRINGSTVGPYSTGGGSSAWDALTNPSGNLVLTMSTNLTAFNTATAVAGAFKWANTTAAVVGTSQSSPTIGPCGTGFHASASISVCELWGVVPGAGNDAAITVNHLISTTSTGTVTDQFSGPLASGASGTGVGGGLTAPEGTAISGIASSDVLFADSTAHRWKVNNNNGGAGTLAVFTDNLSVFGATTSAQLAGVISDETGSGALVFATSPTLVTPVLGTPTSGTLTNATGYLEQNITGASAAGTITEGGATFSVTRAGIATANLTAPWVFQNTNSSNNNTSITSIFTSPGTSTGQTTLNINGATTQGNLLEAGTGGTVTAGVISGQTKVFQVSPTGAVSLGTAPTCTAGTSGGAICETESSTDTTGVSSTFVINGNSNDHAGHWSSNNGTVQHLPQTAFNTSYTNATTGFTSITGLAFTVAASTNYHMECDLTYQGSATTTGLKVQVTGPASPTSVSFNYTQTITTSTTVAATFASASATAFSSAMGDTVAITATTNMPAHLTMSLANGANAGTVQVQGAADGTGTVTVQPSSCVLQ